MGVFIYICILPVSGAGFCPKMIQKMMPWLWDVKIILLMEEIPHHLLYMEAYEKWDILTYQLVGWLVVVPCQQCHFPSTAQGVFLNILRTPWWIFNKYLWFLFELYLNYTVAMSYHFKILYMQYISTSGRFKSYRSRGSRISLRARSILITFIIFGNSSCIIIAVVRSTLLLLSFHLHSLFFRSYLVSLQYFDDFYHIRQYFNKYLTVRNVAARFGYFLVFCWMPLCHWDCHKMMWLPAVWCDFPPSRNSIGWCDFPPRDVT